MQSNTLSGSHFPTCQFSAIYNDFLPHTQTLGRIIGSNMETRIILVCTYIPEALVIVPPAVTAISKCDVTVRALLSSLFVSFHNPFMKIFSG